MAQTKRKRRSKHRGNAAGMIETRGRTGRTTGTRTSAPAPKTTAAQRRAERMDRPPTWRGAINRAAIMAAVFGLILLVVPGFNSTPAQTLPLLVFMFVLYIPLGYYTDAFVYKRRMKMKSGGSSGRRR